MMAAWNNDRQGNSFRRYQGSRILLAMAHLLRFYAMANKTGRNVSLTTPRPEGAGMLGSSGRLMSGMAKDRVPPSLRIAAIGL
jgi:hypothetical protein